MKDFVCISLGFSALLAVCGFSGVWLAKYAVRMEDRMIAQARKRAAETIENIKRQVAK